VIPAGLACRHSAHHNRAASTAAHRFTAGDDGTVRLWDIHNPATVSQLKLGASLAALAWGPRGITVAAHTELVQLAIIDRAAGTTGHES
jgi:WD40 repeat protein